MHRRPQVAAGPAVAREGQRPANKAPERGHTWVRACAVFDNNARQRQWMDESPNVGIAFAMALSLFSCTTEATVTDP